MIIELKAEVKNKLLEFRNLERLLTTPEFEAAWSRDQGNTFIVSAIKAGNLKVVKDWVQNILITEVGEMSVRELRARAAKLGISRVSLYTKDELIVKIIQAQDDRQTEKATC